MMTTPNIDFQKMSSSELATHLILAEAEGLLTRDEFQTIMDELSLRGEHLEVLAGLSSFADLSWR
jgi:hypothetical protein